MTARPFLPSALPLIGAPMAGSGGTALALAVCRAGGLGSLPAAMLSPDKLREQVADLRAGTDAPFNINFFCHTQPTADAAVEERWRGLLARYYREHGLDPAAVPDGVARAPFDSTFCSVVEDVRPAVVSFHFGLPGSDLVARVKRTGALLVGCATTVAEARWLEANGADAVIAQGAEAGGHRGMFLTTDTDAQPGLFALLPQVRDAVRVPVIAAGGIADRRGVAAAFALGADAVQVGTAYLRTPEALTSRVHRAALAEARDDATRLTNLFSGRPARGLLNRLMREQGPLSQHAPAFPTASTAVAPLRSAAEGGGLGDFSPLWAGEAAALARDVDAETLTRELGEAVRLACT